MAVFVFAIKFSLLEPVSPNRRSDRLWLDPPPPERPKIRWVFGPNLKTMGVYTDALMVAPIPTFPRSQTRLRLCCVLVNQGPISLHFISCWLEGFNWTRGCIHWKGVGGRPVVGVAADQASHIETKSFGQVHRCHVDRPLWVANIAHSTSISWLAVLQLLGWGEKSFQGRVAFKVALCLRLHSRLGDVLSRVNPSQVFGHPDQFVQVFWGEASALPPAEG